VKKKYWNCNSGKDPVWNGTKEEMIKSKFKTKIIKKHGNLEEYVYILDDNETSAPYMR